MLRSTHAYRCLVVAAIAGLVLGLLPDPARADPTVVAPAAGGCGALAQRIAALPRTTGYQPVSCLDMTPAASSTDRAGTAASCSDGWFVASRFVGCGRGSGHLFIIHRPTNQVVGGLDYTVNVQVTVNGRSGQWVHTWVYTAGFSWGQVSGATITATPECRTACQLPGAAPVVRGSALTNHSHSANINTVAQGTDTSWSSASAWRWHFTSPVTTPADSEPSIWTAPPHRCDNALPGRPVGCTFPSVVPTHDIGRTRFPTYARHIQLSLLHGLPSTLTRATQAQADANRAVACPPSQPRPTGMSCDEYPFASSQQGAASQPYGRQFVLINKNQPELSFVCRANWLLVRAANDSGGYSSCMIPAAENSGGGSDLDIFYYDNRVIRGDQFRVRVV